MMALPTDDPDDVLHLDDVDIHHYGQPQHYGHYQHLPQNILPQNSRSPSAYLGPPRYPPQLQSRLSRALSNLPQNLYMHLDLQPHDEDLQLDPLIAQQMQGPSALSQLGHSISSEMDSAYNTTPLNAADILARGPEDDLLEEARKVAPRSTNLFRVGPPFEPTVQHRSVYCGDTNERATPILATRIDRGFELGETGNWIGYKRNYFTLVLAFNFDGWDFERFLRSKFYTYDKKDGVERKVAISYFAVSIVAKCSDPEALIGLVQHTPKRDKGPQYAPPIYPAIPGELPDHVTVKASCNKRNGSKIESMNKIFNFDRAEYYRQNDLDQYKDQSVLHNYPSDTFVRVARFERIQFTASIRFKSATTNHKYFTLNVELLGIVEDEEHRIQPVLIASTESLPLLVRGRSPSNYPKDRTLGFRGPLHAYGA